MLWMFGPTILPFWYAGPLGVFAMLVIAGHLIALRNTRGRIPESRYRIRTVNGGIMLLTVPMLASAFSVVSPEDPGAFTLIWLTCIGLLAIVVVLTMVDALNSARLWRIYRRQLREEHRLLLDALPSRVDREADHDS